MLKLEFMLFICPLAIANTLNQFGKAKGDKDYYFKNTKGEMV